MRKLSAFLAACIILAALLPLVLATGNNVYIAQTAAGLGDGSSCVNAVAQSYFNTSGNWSGSPTGIQIGPGTTVHLCGTFTEAAGASGTLTAQGNGSSGNPVRIQYETGANATAPYWGSGGFITVNGHSFIQIDGSPTSTPCGYVNSIDVSCNGTIQATANGASLANHVANSHGISLGSGTHDIEVRNIYCQNLFVPVQNSANNETTNGINNSACVWWFPSGGGGGGNINSHNLEINNSFNGVLYAYQGSNANMHADNMWSTNIDVCAQIGAGTSGASITSGSWNNNDCSNMAPWDTPGDRNHHEFIHLYTQQPGATISGFTIAGNYLHGTLGAFMTAEIYVECDGGALCTSPTSIHVAEYNNVIVNEDPNADISTGAGGNGMNECEGSTCQIYQNTYFSLAQYASTNFAQHTEAGGVITAQGNIFDGMWSAFVNGGGTITASTNLGYGLHVACGSPCSVSTNPLLNLSSTPPYQLQSGSSAIAAANNQTALGITGLDSDQLGAARPPVGNWDMGAFNITGTSPGISFTPTSLTFASQTTGTTSAPKNIVVKNTGTATLLISSVALTGTNSGDFGQTNNCAGGISAGGSCTIAVTFTPSATGSRTASVSVTDNAAGSPQTVGLTGTGASATAVVSFTPTSLAFGSQAVLTTSAQQNVTVFNSGSGTLNLSGITLTGTNPSDFAIVAPTGVNARADQVAQPYNAGAGTIPCPGSNGCSAVILASISVTGTAGTATFQHTFGSCPFGAATTTQVNGNTLLAENKLHTIATCNGTGFTYSDGVATGTGTDGVASSTGGALVGAGTVIPSDFPNVSLVRVTDNLTKSITGGATPGKNGWTVTTTGSSETKLFDKGNHMFVAQAVGNSSYAFSFTPATMASAIMYSGAQIDPNGAHEPTASSVTPYLYYNSELFGGHLSIVSYNFSGAVNPTGTQVQDLTVPCGASLPGGLVASNDEPSVNFNDTIFSAVGQTTPGQNNTITREIVYNTSTSTCYVWDRGGTGHWFLNGVDQGTITIHNTSSGTTYTSDTDLQSIHQMRSNYSGQIAGQTTEACLGGVNCTDGLTYWVVGTSNAYFSAEVFSPDTGAGNHTTTGNNDVFFMRANCPTFCDAIYSAPLTNPFGSTLLNSVPGDTVGGDAHPSGANIVDDTQPVCMSHTFDGVGQFQTFLVPFAWNNEFHCQETVPPYRGFRLTHNYASATVTAIFNSAAGVSSVSQDGRFFITATDFGALLGATDGVSAKCNSSNNGTAKCRTDIFVGNIPSAVACGATLAPGGTCEVGVTFRPTASGSRSANLTFTDNAAGSPQNVPLTGTGTSSAAVSLSPSSLTFGPQALTTTSASQQVNLYNVGGTTLSISGITLIGTNPGDFTQTNNCGSSVLAGGSCAFRVTFTPSANGARSASIQITDSAAGSPQTVPLSGTGFTATPALSIVPSSLIFATQTVGTPSNAQVIILSNTGTATVTFSSISITGANTSDFGQTNNCGSSLPVNTLCSILVTFMPTAAGTRTANVSIADNVSGSPQVVPLSGTGVVGPLVAPDPAIFAYDAR